MKSLRLLLLLAVGCCFLRSEPASAQATAPAYTFPKQYSADVVVTTGQGQTMTMKTYRDTDKIRTEMSANGMQVVSIIRPDQQKMYSVMVAQKMVMVMPFDPAKAKQMMTPGSGSDVKVELVGPEAAEGVAATKYKITNKDGKVIFVWVDPATSVPVKIAADDGSFTEVFKNFQAGPQDASLFEPPAGYQVMNMPSAPSMPPGAGQ
jgi:outer membrane lipoprotein-sorting protein